MKFDAAWVNRSAQCPDGMAWWLDYVKDGGKSLPEAVLGFDRADFLLWFLVKAEVLPVESALDLLTQVSRARLDDAPPYIGMLDVASKSELRRARTDCAVEAEHFMTTGDFRRGHGASVVAFLARMRLRILEVDLDEALKDGQCVLNNLVAARTGSLIFSKPEAKQEHEALCEWLLSCVIVVVDSRRRP